LNTVAGIIPPELSCGAWRFAYIAIKIITIVTISAVLMIQTLGTLWNSI